MLKGKVAVITGASRGIGAAISRRLAEDGAIVALTGRSMDRASHSVLDGTLCEVGSVIRSAGGMASEHEMDVRSDDSVSSAVRDIVRAHGKVDILVNNASAVDLTGERFDLMHGVNARGTLICIRECLPHLKESSGQVVSISPPINVQFDKWARSFPAYAMSKYGMTIATIGASSEVKANCLWPKRTIATAATKKLEGASGVPYYTQGRPAAYFAEAVRDLACDDFVNGKMLLDEQVLPNIDTLAPMDAFV